jgi:hypothetical protein
LRLRRIGTLSRIKVIYTGAIAMKMFSLLRLFAAATISLLMTGTALAADQGTAAEAEAMVKKAVAYIKTNGTEKSYEEFTNGKSFKDRDLYVSVLDMTGKSLAHGANPKLVGKDISGIKDPDGKLLVQMFIDLAKTKGKGWTDVYKFRNPTTDKISDKTRVSRILCKRRLS